MSNEPEVTRIVRSWLEEGATSLPDRVLDIVLDQLPATPQRRARRPAWRLNSMTTPIRLAAAAAAIGVLAVVSSIVPRTLGPGTPNLMQSPSPSPSPMPLEAYAPELAAGAYEQPIGAARWIVTVPEGWEVYYGVLWADVDGQRDFETYGGPGEVAFGWWVVGNVFADPCHWKDSLADPPVGPTVDDLATAFVTQVERDGSVTDVVFGGLPAKRVDLSPTADIDVTTCDEGVYWEFMSPGESVASPPEALPETAGTVRVLYIMDIDGTRMMMSTWHRPDASAEDVAEMEAMLASSRIELPAPSPSAAPSPSPAA